MSEKAEPNFPNRSRQLSDSEDDQYPSGVDANSGSEDELADDAEQEDEAPMTAEEQEQAIQRIVAALKDVSNIAEPEKTQAVVRIRNGDHYPEEAYENLAMEALVRFHKQDVWPFANKQSVKASAVSAYASRREAS